MKTIKLKMVPKKSGPAITSNTETANKAREYYQKNRERCLEWARRYRENNPEKREESVKKYQESKGRSVQKAYRERVKLLEEMLRTVKTQEENLLDAYVDYIDGQAVVVKILPPNKKPRTITARQSIKGEHYDK